MQRPTAQSRPPQPLRPRHIPQRTCVACRTVQAKRELLRIVRTPTGRVLVDLVGKAAGRGAYLHKDPACWREGLRKGRLARALRMTISAEDQSALEAVMKDQGFALSGQLEREASPLEEGHDTKEDN